MPRDQRSQPDDTLDSESPELAGPAPTPDEMGMGGGMDRNEVCVDVDSLAMPDEQDQMQAPAEGDKVQLAVEGTVSRIDGNKAYVTMTAVNGKEVSQEPAEDDLDAQTEALRAEAAGMPERY